MEEKIKTLCIEKAKFIYETHDKLEEELEKEIGDIFDHKVKEPEKEKVEDLDFNKFIVPMPEDLDDEYTTKAPETTTHFEQVVEEPVKVSIEEPKKEEIPTEIPRFTSPYAHNQVQPEVQTVEPKPVSTIENIEKPKVNIDVDSVVVNNKPNDEDFFDDFFGSEDE